MNMVQRHNDDIKEHIDNLESKVETLILQQKAEQERKFASKLAKTNAEIEQKAEKQEGNAADLMKQEAEYRRKLELITNIA
jgi:predicted ribosome quality control (RQC) complex YloA/Tae2 family protein